MSRFNSRKFLNNRPILAKVIKGFGLVSLERFSRVGLNIIAQFFIAKYLGPERYGQVSVPLKFIGLFMTIPVFGMDELLVKELIKSANNSERFSIIKATVIVRFCLATTAALLAISVAYFSFGTDSTNFTYVIACSLILLFYPFVSLELFFQNQMDFNVAFRSKFVSAIGITAARLFGAVKLYSVLFFILLNIAEYLFLAVLYVVASVSHLKELISVKADFKKILSILREAAPLALASFLMLAEQRYSLILLERHRPDDEVGLFALSLTALDVLQYFPIAMGLATFPVLVATYESSVDQFRQKIKSVMGIISSLSLFGLILNLLIGEFLINAVLGERYKGLSSLLNWIFLLSFFYNANQIRTRWLVILGNVRVWLLYSLVSLVFSIFLQSVLVPSKGALGVFYSLILGQVVANMIVSYFSTEFRDTFISLLTSPYQFFKTVASVRFEKK